MVLPSPRPSLDSPRIDRTNRPIDLVHLARQTMGDRALEHEVLRMFSGQVTAYFDRVRASGDTYEITLGLHTLKGASRGVGAVTLAALSEAAEHEFRDSGALDDETLDDLAMAVAEVCAYISAIVED
ncbi:Hpt domain-containing protein [Pelagibacterium luteolum]|uniref:Hpt domain-containing protein n=1 Tax=Pelagibacterium luteolum TaxID=440168 RepID=A0A1G7UFG3_9HYPH|nr:Hpt domain-containing protein [Pelagibacterium luteolum]SDG46197.1 Hpt domain-containing protein [Pelagibacterium luteolum]